MSPPKTTDAPAGTRRRILVTSALPYANGSIHLGHVTEVVYTDVWVRFQKLRGHECWYVCADDTHGTAIMLRAEKEGVTPEELIEATQREHERDFADFAIGFDNYGTTHSQRNREFVEAIWRRLRDGDHVVQRSVTQFFDAERGIFLADRFVKGTCPRCKTPNQNGDSCDNCAATYTPQDLIDPVSALSGTRPEERDSEHFFVRLADFEEVLRGWATTDNLQPEVVNKLEEWFAEGLRDWDVSRDAPYFGFEIPDAPGKYFYVWVDAPIGYLASFAELCEREGIEFDDFWKRENAGRTEVYHVIGKDILYFHCLFWPALLWGGGYRLPTSVPVHGFLTVDGTKMSKSRGTFIMARTYLDHLPADALRYYLAAKLGSGLGDIDLNLQDFVQRVNSDLVGKAVNIASRCAGFLHKHSGGRLADALDDAELFERFAAAGDEIAELYERRSTNQAVRRIMALADEANRYVDERKPWVLAKQEETRDQVAAVCTTGINLFRTLLIYLKPIVPGIARRGEQFLGGVELGWDDRLRPLLGETIAPYEPLMTRIEAAAVEAVVEASKDTMTASPDEPAETPEPAGPPGGEEIGAEITIDDFAKLDLRVARIVRAEAVEGADKLLRLELDLGSGVGRQVFAGIKSAYSPEDLVDRHVVVVANLKARKMRFGTSEGMVLAAGPGGEEIFLVSPDAGASPGLRVR
ncbi:MAG: methionine--tRNA ligase [Acidobacteria bacterium]|nr:MAG: methionine--tRNA ligase [Acidobacteriota bacterium]REK04613.1 MAG: methionine--tRNA ligase [Acidobacteriota bacterium]